MSEPRENILKNRKAIFVNNFIGGIAWALGATIGASIIFAVLALVLKNINFVPFVGNFVVQVVDFVNKNNSSFR